jgi:DNA invertase Pin-like site-specific DNA recombinase
MMADINKWDGLLVMKMDRAHRSQTNFTGMMAILSKHYKHFVSMTESYDTSTAIGRLLMDFSVRLAQFESEQTGERTYVGMHQKAKQRGFTGHRACFGYRTVKTNVLGKAGKNLSKLVPVPEELEIVKEIFKLYNEGLSMPRISKQLDMKYGKIHYILKNPLYVGYYKWHNIIKKADDIEPIISITLWDLVQKRKCQEADRGKYIPLLIKDRDVFEVSMEKIKDMPAIRRAKHNLSY